jgi:hypothetical protein
VYGGVVKEDIVPVFTDPEPKYKKSWRSMQEGRPLVAAPESRQNGAATEGRTYKLGFSGLRRAHSQLVSHPHEVSHRIRFHFLHHYSPVSLDGPLGGS